MTEIRGNFDDPERKRHALDVVRALTGNQRVTIVDRPSRGAKAPRDSTGSTRRPFDTISPQRR
jgi:hypothetical protein